MSLYEMKFSVLSLFKDSYLLGLPASRIQLMIQVDNITKDDPSSQRVLDGINGRYFRAIAKIFKREGLLGFYKGWSAYLAGAIQAAIFPIFSKFWKSALISFGLDPLYAEIGISAFTSFSLYPMKFCYTDMCLDFNGTDYGRNYTGLADCVKKNFDNGGVFNFYIGAGWHFVGEVFLHLTKFYLKKFFKNMEIDKGNQIVLGLYIGLLTSFVVYPMSTLSKRRIAGRFNPDPEKRNLFGKEMMKGLYHGYALTFAGVIASGINEIVFAALFGVDDE